MKEPNPKYCSDYGQSRCLAPSRIKLFHACPLAGLRIARMRSYDVSSNSSRPISMRLISLVPAPIS